MWHQVDPQSGTLFLIGQTWPKGKGRAEGDGKGEGGGRWGIEKSIPTFQPTLYLMQLASSDAIRVCSTPLRRDSLRLKNFLLLVYQYRRRRLAYKTPKNRFQILTF